MWIAFLVVFGLLGLVLGLVALVSILFGLSALFWAVLPVTRVPLRYNLRNLQNRWKTTMVTALAFTLVTALLAIMLAFVRGMERQTDGTGNAANVMVFSDGATDEAFSSLPATQLQLFEDKVLQAVEKTADGQKMFSQELYMSVSQILPKPLPDGRKRRFVQMRGLDNPALSAAVHDIELAAGRWPAGYQQVEGEPGKAKQTVSEIALGDGIARTLGADYGKETLGLGDVVEIGPAKWIVVGLMKPGQTTFGSEIWAYASPVSSQFKRPTFTTYVLRTKDADTATEVAKWIRETQRDKAYDAKTERAYYASLTATTQQFTGAIYSIAIIMAVGGVLGVMNTMFAAISQRTKDIGVLRMLGYSRLQILLSFLLESLVIGMLGAVLGVALGFVFHGINVSTMVTSGQGGGKTIALVLLIEPFIIVGCLLFAFVMGAVGGFIPSLSAMRLKPLESLR